MSQTQAHYSLTPSGYRRLVWARVSDTNGVLCDYTTDVDFYAYIVDRPSVPPRVELFNTQRAMRAAIFAKEGARI